MEQSSEQCSAGIIVIGDEILRGHVVDVNSQYLCRQLWNLGIDVRKVVVVGDSVSAIEAEVRLFSQSFTHVFTCGGIGPTHDDVTLEAIANAFDEQLCNHDELLSLFSAGELESCRKMAKVPTSTKLCYPPSWPIATHGEATEEVSTTGSSRDSSDSAGSASVNVSAPVAYPALRIHNVFALPGVPVFLKEGFRAIKSLLRSSASEFHLFEVSVQRPEAELASTLSTVQNDILPNVQLGSYPQFEEDGSQKCVVLRLESVHREKLNKARQLLLHHLCETSILGTSVRRSSARTPSISESSDPGIMSQSILDHERAALARSDHLSVDKVIHLAGSPHASHFSKVIANALCIIEEAMNRYGSGGLCLCFNGGKDCTVLLHLLSIVRHRQLHQQSSPTPIGSGGSGSSGGSTSTHSSSDQLVALYIRSNDPFPEVEVFIQESTEKYNLELLTFEGSYKDALAWQLKSHPHIKAMLMGTRRTDPYAADLSPFVMTDKDWPQIMRVNPILDFSYSDVWRFLRDLNVSYCSLYDQGYTSLGGRSTTKPNPALHVENQDGRQSAHLPAYLLSNGDRERDGRVKRKTPVT
eukprot:scpid40969/ scgid31877/ FAD synthase; FAD pyrophosphorylase; FMN adenylyltransferase; Flavin adenine dinucleotide synthase; Molybdenum cofactor biosynthesis protein-like region; FAD synthase region